MYPLASLPCSILYCVPQTKALYWQAGKFALTAENKAVSAAARPAITAEVCTCAAAI